MSRQWWRVTIRVVFLGSVFGIAGLMTGAFLLLLFLHQGLPSIDSLKVYQPSTVSRVYAEHGEVIGEFFNERRLVRKDFPDLVKKAFIAAEDSHFYTHKGVDFLGMLRATYVNIIAGGYKQGASTITQQVARAFLLSPEKTLARKLKEMLLAWQIEKNLTKDEILNLYLNHIFLGRGAYGVASASEVHFGKPVEKIGVAEAAILAGLPQAPSRYSPAKNPDRVKRRQLYVLKQMVKLKFITDEEYLNAAKQEVIIHPVENINKTLAPYFVETVRQYVMNKYGAKKVLEEGFQIYTTLDLEMNHQAQNALRKGLSEIDKRQGYFGPLKRLKSSEVSAYFEGRKFEERETGAPAVAMDLEVAPDEVEGTGKIVMKSRSSLEEGDWLEGVVIKVDDSKGEAFVEYDPGLLAKLHMDDLRWAHERIRHEDDEQVVYSVSKVSDVLRTGDVVLMTVKAIPPLKKAGVLPPIIDAYLEQIAEAEGAVYTIEPSNGYVRTMVGGYDFNRSQFNRAIQAKRQPGSSFKPIIYAAGLDLGFTPATILQDSPITFANDLDQEKWRPKNYDGRFVGDITLRNSLITSRNITTIKLLNEVGLDAAIHYARRLGIESPLSRDFTLGLGSSVVTLNEIVRPYMVFASGGYLRPSIMIKKIVDREGNILEENVHENFEQSILDQAEESLVTLKKEAASVVLSDITKAPTSSASFLKESPEFNKKDIKPVTSNLKPGQVLSTETSYLMTHLLKENILYGTGKKIKELNRPASGKTGTTDDNRDAWFIGFTPNLVTGVWVGYDDLRVLGKQETGSKAAAPIWLDAMAKSLAPWPVQDFEVPTNIEFAKIDPKTGGLAMSSTRNPVFEAFVKGTAPTAAVEPARDETDLYEGNP